MYVSKLSDILTILCCCLHILIIFASKIPSSYHIPPPDNIIISCGSSGNSTALDGRVWIGDSGFESSLFLQINGKSSNSRAIHKLDLLDSVPYKTARISRHEFHYVFTVKPGQKIIRLHFHQDSYQGFKKSKPLFNVKAGPYTLLSNFSIPLGAGVGLIVKEYCVNIEDDRGLTLTFSPSLKTRKSDDFYAFINGIEVISMPMGLYFTPEAELGPQVVGQKYRFFIDGTTALETVQRLNVGGTSVLPTEDSFMFRRWDEDSNFLLEKSADPVKVGYRGTATYIAPTEIYQTARSLHTDSKSPTWKIPVDLGFRYLMRLHFSNFQPRIGESGEKEIIIVINNQIAWNSAEKNRGSGDYGVAIYRDYIVTMDGDKMMGKRNITLTFQRKFELRCKQFHDVLTGLEIFKLSNPDNNLAGIEPVPWSHSTRIPRQKKRLSIYSGNSIPTVVTVILILINTAVYYLRRVSESNFGTKSKRSSTLKHPCRQFSINEIRSSTDNFNPEFHIGSGGYGEVYKGSIDGGAKMVAIKQLKLGSRQGENEFWTEIKMLSKIRHEHLVSLIGYCNDGHERLLVYHYMTRGTLADHLPKINGNRKSNPPLPWELLLKVSIGAAHGLYYLHSRHRVIHRDVKSSNILLDENWVAKISDFGLSKMGPEQDSFTHISTNVKGTFGYLDPEYFLTHKLTRKSDVYSFGVVLFEVLSGRPAVDIRLQEDQHSLAGWARYCIREGKVDRLIDHDLMGQISRACLKVFVGIAGRCIHTKPQGRPAMADVVMGLELALALQQNKDPVEQVEDEENAGRIYSDQSDGIISMDDISITPPKGESDRIISEDTAGAGSKNRGTDQKSNLPPRWWWNPFGILRRTPAKTRTTPLSSQIIILQFSLQEIQKATNNFHNSLIIGFGGSDNVYKGYIDGRRKVVAIRRSINSESRYCMARELQSKKEIQMKSGPNQDQVASLIGYCETESEMMLVYDYMANGTLHDHLHDPDKDPLPWKQRLQICIGAARGLTYIHSIVKQTMLHRNLRSTNIWLDEHWSPKVSEWGLSKKKADNRVPIVGGKWRFLDSDFIRDDYLTEKSCVYSFGLVLFEVLCADKDSNRWLEEDQVSLVQWIKSSMRSNPTGCVDPYLVGRTSPDSLKIFIETTGRCFLDNGTDRPSMNEIVTRLEAALKQQEVRDGNNDGAQLLRS